VVVELLLPLVLRREKVVGRRPFPAAAADAAAVDAGVAPPLGRRVLLRAVVLAGPPRQRPAPALAVVILVLVVGWLTLSLLLLLLLPRARRRRPSGGRGLGPPPAPRLLRLLLQHRRAPLALEQEQEAAATARAAARGAQAQRRRRVGVRAVFQKRLNGRRGGGRDDGGARVGVGVVLAVAVDAAEAPRQDAGLRAAVAACRGSPSCCCCRGGGARGAALAAGGGGGGGRVGRQGPRPGPAAAPDAGTAASADHRGEGQRAPELRRGRGRARPLEARKGGPAAAAAAAAAAPAAAAAARPPARRRWRMRRMLLLQLLHVRPLRPPEAAARPVDDALVEHVQRARAVERPAVVVAAAGGVVAVAVVAVAAAMLLLLLLPLLLPCR
jgi:hypothetical protein